MARLNDHGSFFWGGFPDPKPPHHVRGDQPAVNGRHEICQDMYTLYILVGAQHFSFAHHQAQPSIYFSSLSKIIPRYRRWLQLVF